MNSQHTLSPIRVSEASKAYHMHQSFVSIDINAAPQSFTGHTANIMWHAKNTRKLIDNNVKR
jgi:hypothetical protein